MGSELNTLLGVEDLGLTEPQGKAQRIEVVGAVKRVGQLLDEDETAEPVHHGHDVHEAQRHR